VEGGRSQKRGNSVARGGQCITRTPLGSVGHRPRCRYVAWGISSVFFLQLTFVSSVLNLHDVFDSPPLHHYVFPALTLQAQYDKLKAPATLVGFAAYREQTKAMVPALRVICPFLRSKSRLDAQFARCVLGRVAVSTIICSVHAHRSRNASWHHRLDSLLCLFRSMSPGYCSRNATKTPFGNSLACRREVWSPWGTGFTSRSQQRKVVGIVEDSAVLRFVVVSVAP